MPLYEYRCKKCGSVSEFLSTIGDTGETLACKSCGGNDLEKLLSVTTIPSYPSPRDGKTCCGRDERCDSPPCDTGCCTK